MANFDPIPYADSVEVIPSDEIDDIRRAIQTLEKILKRSREQSGQYQGDVHVKVHGCATGEFRVLPNLPAELAQGVFAEERTFQAVVRFSNSASQPQPDFIPDGRGLAIKLLDVPGEKIAEIRARAQESLDGARDRMRDAGERIGERARSTARTTDEYVHENPWTAVAIAVGVGFLLGTIGRRR